MQFHEPLYQGTVPGTTLPYQVRLYLGMVARDSFMLPKRMLWSIIIGESIVLLILRPNIYSQLIHYQHETSRPEFATASSTAVSTCSNDNIVSTQRDLSTRQFTDHLCACFTDRTELRNAISQFLNDGCSDDNNCKNTVVQNYGWPIGSWCVSNVTDMSLMFSDLISFNEDLSSWDVSQVTDMRKMFVGASSFNQDLSSWELRGICFFSNKVEFIHAVLLTTVVGVVRSHCVNNLFVCSSFSLYRFRFVANIYSCIIYNLVVCITPLICVKNAAQRSAVQRSAAQCSAVQRSAVQCSAAQCILKVRFFRVTNSILLVCE